MKTIDGSRGEGGGQILRTALSLSMVTGEPLRIERIRAGRGKPGLLRQHLTCIQAAKSLCGATVEGDELGSSSLTFHPGSIRSGEFAFAVGSAGSATLVFQTVLPALLHGDAPTTLTIEGGTHNPNAPPFDHLAKVFLPLITRLGPGVEATLERPGFYPSGGGRFLARVHPVGRLGGLELLDRGPLEGVRVRALVAGLPRRIADRECQVLRDALELERWAVQAEEVDGTGPGNVVMVELRSVALGCGGRFRTGELSSHASTQIELLREWLGVEIRAREARSGGVEVEVGRP